MDSQNEVILAWLQSGKSITSWQAIQKFRCTRLASRIHDLKQKGYNIKSSLVCDVNDDGDPVRYSVYWLEE